MDADQLKYLDELASQPIEPHGFIGEANARVAAGVPPRLVVRQTVRAFKAHVAAARRVSAACARRSAGAPATVQRPEASRAPRRQVRRRPAQARAPDDDPGEGEADLDRLAESARLSGFRHAGQLVLDALEARLRALLLRLFRRRRRRLPELGQ